MNIRYPIYEGVYRILTFKQYKATYGNLILNVKLDLLLIQSISQVHQSGFSRQIWISLFHCFNK